MTGPQSGDAEDLLGQFLAHRGTPPPADRPAASESVTADEAVEESVDGAVYELTDEPLDFSEPTATAQPEAPLADTMAHAGAVLQAFASGTLDVEHDGAQDVEDVQPVGDLAAAEAGAPETGADEANERPANDAAQAVLAAFLGRSDAAPEPARQPSSDDAAAFEALAVSSPLTREPAPPGPQADSAPSAAPAGRADVTDDRPDSTAASAAVFAAFQEQLAKEEPPAPSRAPAPPRIPEAAPEPRRAPEAEPEMEGAIAPPVARAQAPKPARQRAPRPEPKVTAPRLPAPAAPAADPASARAAVPNEVVFKPRRVARAFVALVLIVFIAASAIACWWAYRDRTLVPVGIAATVLIATGIVWATRAGSSVARLSVKGGRLEITKDGTRTVFDLASRYTDIDVRGTAGKRGWKVLFGRRGLPPYVVDASMVSPTEFMRVLDYYRPTSDRHANS